jgi:DNA repair protein RecN (Recombination protein N)
VQTELRRLAMPKARFEVRVGAGGGEPAPRSPSVGVERDDWRELSGEDVCFMLAANAGEPLLPLWKVASGGELARTMLALRLALLAGGQRSEDISGPETLVFDEVDAGIGGEAAVAVGRALAELSRRYQVLVVTHLPQVAAFATAQVAVSKTERRGRTVTTASEVSGEERLAELSRMLSGQPASKTARLHAEELLSNAGENLRDARPPAKRAARRAGPARRSSFTGSTRTSASSTPIVSTIEATSTARGERTRVDSQ